MIEHVSNHRNAVTSAASHPELVIGELVLSPRSIARPARATSQRSRVLASSLFLCCAMLALSWGADLSSRSALQDDRAVAAQRERATAAVTAREPLPVLLPRVAAWLHATFDLPLTEALPEVAYVSPDHLVALRYGGLGAHANGQKTAHPAPGSVVAVYDDARQTIYLPKGWSGASPAEQSVLVHELVHHVQNRAGLKYDCPAQREKLAYEAQERWLERFGTSLEQEFELDPFTLFVRMSCF
jgi:hypothetical protein